MNANQDILKVGLAQMAPVWLDRDKTINKVCNFIEDAASKNCELVVFGEALVPGYPFWIERTDGARFNSNVQKEIFAHYLEQGVQIEAGHYSRPDVTQLTVNRERQSIVKFKS